MDLSCPSCHTDYEIDESRVPETGLVVKCRVCATSFRVALPERESASLPPASSPRARGVTSSTGWRSGSTIPPAARSAPPAVTAPAGAETPPANDAGRTWRIRKVDGTRMSTRELTTLQRWIVEGRVERDDQLSANGEEWRAFSLVKELEVFFDVAADAAYGRTMRKIVDSDAKVAVAEGAVEASEALVEGLPLLPTTQAALNSEAARSSFSDTAVITPDRADDAFDIDVSSPSPETLAVSAPALSAEPRPNALQASRTAAPEMLFGQPVDSYQLRPERSSTRTVVLVFILVAAVIGAGYYLREQLRAQFGRSGYPTWYQAD